MHLGLHSLWSSSVMLIYVRCCEFESGLRWALVQAGEWGDPDTKTLKDLMAIAFEDFRAWRRQRGVYVAKNVLQRRCSTSQSMAITCRPKRSMGESFCSFCVKNADHGWKLEMHLLL